MNKDIIVIGVTHPSMFSGNIHKMVQKGLRAMPLILNHDRPDHLEFLLNQCDGIILAGGSDISPVSFGEDIMNGVNLTKFDTKRDRREIFISEWAMQRNVPILGICRGHQMLARISHLPFLLDIGDSDVCHNPITQNIHMEQEEPIHGLEIQPEFETEKLKNGYVNSFHHQAVEFDATFDYAAEGVNVLGTALTNILESDQGERIVELMASPKKNWISCQWHPEEDFKSNPLSQYVVNSFNNAIKARLDLKNKSTETPVAQKA